MSNTFNYVRRKDSPLICLMAGYSKFDGQFDETIYEQVEEPLPENTEFEKNTSSLETLSKQVATLKAIDRAYISNTEASIAYLLGKHPADKDAVRLLLEELPDEPFLKLKQTVLGTL